MPSATYPDHGTLGMAMRSRRSVRVSRRESSECSTTSLTSVSGSPLRRVLTCSVVKPEASSPSIEMILSPMRIPARSAGEPSYGCANITWSPFCRMSEPTPPYCPVVMISNEVIFCSGRYSV